jgi:hypothetical protein
LVPTDTQQRTDLSDKHDERHRRLPHEESDTDTGDT